LYSDSINNFAYIWIFSLSIQPLIHFCSPNCYIRVSPTYKPYHKLFQKKFDQKLAWRRDRPVQRFRHAFWIWEPYPKPSGAIDRCDSRGTAVELKRVYIKWGWKDIFYSDMYRGYVDWLISLLVIMTVRYVSLTDQSLTVI